MRNRTQNRSERGSALVIAIVTVVGITAIAIAMTAMAFSSSRSTESSEDRTQAWMLVEAGFQAALQEINANKDIDGDGKIGVSSKTFGPNNRYSYNASLYTGTDTDGSYTGQNIGSGNRRLICSGSVKGDTGGSGDVARRGEAVVKDSSTVTNFPMFWFGDKEFRCNGGMATDSYRSSKGSYSEQVASAPAAGGFPAGTLNAYRRSPAGSQGSIGSNSDIVLGNNTAIWGDATPGVGHTVSNPGTVSGSTAPRSTAFALPPIYIPAVTSAATDAISSGTLNGGEYHWSTWSQKPNETLTIASGSKVNIVVEKNMDLKGTIVISPGATVNVYMKSGDFTCNGGGDISTKRSNDLNFVCDGNGTVKWNGNATLYGTLYAPGMSFTGNGQCTVYGAAIVSTVKLTGGADIHIDLDATTPGIRPKADLVAVREIEFTAAGK